MGLDAHLCDPIASPNPAQPPVLPVARLDNAVLPACSPSSPVRASPHPPPGADDCLLATATAPGACPVPRAEQRGRLVKDGRTPGLPRGPAGSTGVGSAEAGSAAVESWSRAARGGLHWGSPRPSERELGRPRPGSVGAGAAEPRADPRLGGAGGGGVQCNQPRRRRRRRLPAARRELPVGRQGRGPGGGSRRGRGRVPAAPAGSRGRPGGGARASPTPLGKLRLGALSAAWGLTRCRCPPSRAFLPVVLAQGQD